MVTLLSREYDVYGEGCEVLGLDSLYLKNSKFSATLILETIMENSQDTIYFKDRDSKFILSSKAHIEQFGGYDREKFIGKSDFDFFPREFAENARRDELKVMETGIPIIGKAEKWEKEDGSVVWFSASKYPFYDYDGNIIGIWGTSTNVTDIKNTEEELARVNAKLEKANRKLIERSNLDGLSGLYNQNYFYETIKKTILSYSKKNTSNTFSILSMDIDDFKIINDTYGHLIGDFAIKYVANILNERTRKCDMVFRNGGDEFAIVSLDTTLEQAKALAERIGVSISMNPIKVENIEFTMTVSIGVANYENGDNMEQLIKKVDDQLYMSKRNGKNQVN